MAKANDSEAKVFYADTRFERLGRRRGGIEREEALHRAQTAVDDIMPDFAIWLGSEFEALNRALADMDRRPRDMDAMQRALHSCAQLRDVCGTMGYELVTVVARTLCDVIEAYIAGATYDRNFIECHHKAFVFARMEKYRHLTPEQVPELTQGLLRVVEIASIVPSKNGS